MRRAHDPRLLPWRRNDGLLQNRPGFPSGASGPATKPTVKSRRHFRRRSHAMERCGRADNSSSPDFVFIHRQRIALRASLRPAALSSFFLRP